MAARRSRITCERIYAHLPLSAIVFVDGQPIILDLPDVGRSLTQPALARGLPDHLFFSETRHNLGGVFKSAWERGSGLAQFGYPRSEPFHEINLADGRAYLVQYFERHRFEYHPEFAGTANEVLLGLLGNQVLHDKCWEPRTKNQEPRTKNQTCEAMRRCDEFSRHPIILSSCHLVFLLVVQSRLMSQLSQLKHVVAVPRTFLRAALCALLLMLAGALVYRAGERLAALLVFPYPTDTLEGTLLHEARLLRAGEPLYQPLVTDRFVSAPYPPLHPLVLALADLHAGPHVFWSGRLVSLVSALLLAAIIAVAARYVGRSWVAGVLSGALFLATPPVIIWGTRIKPDVFALVWVALGLLLATYSIEPRTKNREPDSLRPQRVLGSWFSVLGAALCFTLAFFSKQTLVVAPLASGLALLLADTRAQWGERFAWRAYRRTLVFGGTYLALTLGVWGALQWWTAGQYNVHIWWAGAREGWWSLTQTLKYVALLKPYWPLMLLSLVLLARAWREPRALVPAIYLLLVPLTLSGAGEVGGNHNHLMETLLALCLAGGSVLGWTLAGARSQEYQEPRTENREPRTTPPAARRPPPASFHPVILSSCHLVISSLIALLWIAQLALAFQPQQWFLGELAPEDAPERFVAFIRNTPGEVLVDDPGLALLANKPIRYDDPSTMGPAAESGAWDQRGLLHDIATQRFSAIVIPVDVKRETYDHAHRWSPEMIAAIKAHYKLLYRDRIMTYVPK